MALLAVLSASCSAGSKTASAGGKLLVGVAKTSGKVAGATTTTAVKTAGSVTSTTVTTTGKAAGAAISAAASTTKTGAAAATKVAPLPLVTFKDTTTGVSRQVPRSQGLKLFVASQTAQFDPYLRAFEIVRGSGVIQSSWKKIKAGAPEPELQPGDVVLVSKDVKRPVATRAGKGF